MAPRPIAAGRIGEVMRQLKIPVGKIWSSEYCRTRQTAEAMGIGPVSTTRAIMNTRAAEYVGGLENLTRRARGALSTPPAAGSNTVFVAHGNLLRAASGEYTGEAGAVVFAPEGSGSFTLVARLEPRDWERLFRRFAD